MDARIRSRPLKISAGQLESFYGQAAYATDVLPNPHGVDRNVYRVFFPIEAYSLSAAGFPNYNEQYTNPEGSVARALFELFISSFDVWTDLHRRVHHSTTIDDDDSAPAPGAGAGTGRTGELTEQFVVVATGDGNRRRRSRRDADIDEAMESMSIVSNEGRKRKRSRRYTDIEAECNALFLEGDPDRPRFHFFITLVVTDHARPTIKRLFDPTNIQGYLLTVVIDDPELTLADVFAARIRHTFEMSERVSKRDKDGVPANELYGAQISSLAHYKFLIGMYQGVPSPPNTRLTAPCAVTGYDIDTSIFKDRNFLINLLASRGVANPNIYFAEDLDNFYAGPKHQTWALHTQRYKVHHFYHYEFPWISIMSRIPRGSDATCADIAEGRFPDTGHRAHDLLSSFGLTFKERKRIDAFTAVRNSLKQSRIVEDTLALVDTLDPAEYAERLETMQNDVLAAVLPAFDVNADIPDTMKETLRWFSSREIPSVSHITRSIFTLGLSPFANMYVSMTESITKIMSVVNGPHLTMQMFLCGIQQMDRRPGLRLNLSIPGAPGIGKSHASAACTYMLIPGTFETPISASPKSWVTGDPIAGNCKTVFVDESFYWMVAPLKRLSGSDQEARLTLQSILSRSTYETSRTVRAEVHDPESGRTMQTFVRVTDKGELNMCIVCTGNERLSDDAMKSRIKETTAISGTLGSLRNSFNTVVDSIADGKDDLNERVANNEPRTLAFIQNTRTLHALVNFAHTLMYVGALPYPPKVLLDFYLRNLRAYLEANGISANVTRHIARIQRLYTLLIIKYAIHMEFFSELSPHRTYVTDQNGNYIRNEKGQFVTQANEFHMKHLLNIKNWFVDNEEIALMAISLNFTDYLQNNGNRIQRDIMEIAGNFYVQRVAQMVQYVNRMSVLFNVQHKIPIGVPSEDPNDESHLETVRLQEFTPDLPNASYHVGPSRSEPVRLPLLSEINQRRSRVNGDTQTADSPAHFSMNSPDHFSYTDSNESTSRFARLARDAASSANEIRFMGQRYQPSNIAEERLRDSIPARPKLKDMPEFRVRSLRQREFIDVNFIKLEYPIDEVCTRVASQLTSKNTPCTKWDVRSALFNDRKMILVPCIPLMTKAPATWEEYCVLLQPAVLNTFGKRHMQPFVIDGDTVYACIHAGFIDEQRLHEGFLNHIRFSHTAERRILLGTPHPEYHQVINVANLRPDFEKPVLQTMHAEQTTHAVSAIIGLGEDGHEIIDADKQVTIVDHSPEVWAAQSFMKKWCVPDEYLPANVRKRIEALYRDPRSPYTQTRGKQVHEFMYPEHSIKEAQLTRQQAAKEKQAISAATYNRHVGLIRESLASSSGSRSLSSSSPPSPSPSSPFRTASSPRARSMSTGPV